MIREPLEIGRVVRSKAGRDAGRRFVVMALLDDEYVLIADGDVRKVEKPKRKKRKHLESTRETISGLRARLAGGMQVEDHELRKALNAEKMREECEDVKV